MLTLIKQLFSSWGSDNSVKDHAFINPTWRCILQFLSQCQSTGTVRIKQQDSAYIVLMNVMNTLLPTVPSTPVSVCGALSCKLSCNQCRCCTSWSVWSLSPGVRFTDVLHYCKLGFCIKKKKKSTAGIYKDSRVETWELRDFCNSPCCKCISRSSFL